MISSDSNSMIGATSTIVTILISELIIDCRQSNESDPTV